MSSYQNFYRDTMNYLGPFSEAIEDRIHGLLEPPSIAYSNVTVRRAFIVWMYCGQKNRFKDVCNYYHHLEALEEKLSSECRAMSRQHEFHLFTNQPPRSAYLTSNFPHLYTDQQASKKKVCSHDSNILKLRELDRLAQRNGTSRSEIVNVSKMIRNYCRTHMKTLERFLKEFKEHTERCGLANTVGNVGSYIKRKIIQDEIELEANYATTLEQMKRNDDTNDSDDKSRTFQVLHNTERKTVIGRNSPRNNFMIVTNELTRADSRDFIKAMGIGDKKDRSSNIVMDFINKFQSYHNKEYGTQESIETDSGNFFDTSLDCDVIDEAKFRTRRFSGSDCIKKDVLMLRNI